MARQGLEAGTENRRPIRGQRALLNLRCCPFYTPKIFRQDQSRSARRGSDFITDWWIVSAAAILILFIIRIAQRVRSKQSCRFWLDATLTATWIVAVGIIILVGANQFGGF